MAARHYDPATGRFLQVDPLGIDAAELYAYAANNPYAFWDPTGLAPVPVTRPTVLSLADNSPQRGLAYPSESGDSLELASAIGDSPTEIFSAIETSIGAIDLFAGAAALSGERLLHGLARGTGVLGLGVSVLGFAHAETPGQYASATLALGIGVAGLTASASVAPFVLVGGGAYFLADGLAEEGVGGLIDDAVSSFLHPLYGNNPAFYEQSPGAREWYRSNYE